jgi:uncharacterized membrane protein YcaP (DUF421 family)
MDIVLRATVVFIVILVLMRILGRRELASMEPFDLIILVVIGDLVQQGVTQNDWSVTGSILAVGTLGVLTVAVSWVSWRFPRIRPVLDGRPVVLLEDGQPIAGNLKRERITVEELAAQARIQQIDSLDKIRWAVLETNGRVSFIAK